MREGVTLGRMLMHGARKDAEFAEPVGRARGQKDILRARLQKNALINTASEPPPGEASTTSPRRALLHSLSSAASRSAAVQVKLAEASFPELDQVAKEGST